MAAPVKRWDEMLKRLPTGPCTAVEVGVWKGRMSQQLLSRHPHLRLYLVDLWQPGVENVAWMATGSKMAQSPRAEVEAALDAVVKLAEAYAPRAFVVREASASAAGHHAHGSLDLVFIDADHSQQAVLADITAWKPKVRPGGWLGGHDYGSARFPGVKDAVHLVFRREQVQVGENNTWWVRL
jgi:hypothetical protein